MKKGNSKPLLSTDAVEFYVDHPVEFVHDNIIVPARSKRPDIFITKQQKDLLNAVAKYERVSVESGHGCHAKGTMVRMYDGSLKAVENVRIGDVLMGDDSTPRIVERLWRGREKMYRVKYFTGDHYDVNESHKLCLKASQSHGKQVFGDITEITVRDYLKKSKRWQRTNVGYKVPVEYQATSQPIRPYVLGCWLGDGYSDCACICNPDKEVVEAWKKEAEKFNCSVRQYRDIHYSTKSKLNKHNGFRYALKVLGVVKNKHIPPDYMQGSIEQRRELLAGILDSDGSLDKNKRGFEITQKRQRLANQIVELARSIGVHATIKKVRKKCYNNGKWGKYYRINIGRNTETIPTRIPRKQPIQKKQRGLNFGFKLIPLGEDDYYGFTLSGNGRYLLKDFTVTRNTGKSTSFAWIGEWFTATRNNNLGNLVKVPVIAPTFHQLYDIIWPEFKLWIPMSRLATWYQTRRDEVYIKGAKDTCFIRARSPKDANNVQGFHSAHLLWLCDEAFGITLADVWETIEGSLTDPLHIKENKIVVGGQHNCITGYVHDTFHRDSDFWHNLRFNAEESPIADKAYSQRIARKYGKNSDVYRIRVLGMEPLGNPEALIQFADVEQARMREVEAHGKLCMGVDPARFGNDLTVVTLAHGLQVQPQKFLSFSDTDDIVNLAIHMLRDYRRRKKCNQTCYIKVDAGGGYGAGTIDALKKNRKDNIVVIPINNEVDDGHPQYANNASVMWGELAEMIEEIQLPNDEDSDFLAEELAARTFDHDNKERIRISPKKQYKKDYGSSPDRADSLVLCMTKAAKPNRIFPSYISTAESLNKPFTTEWDLLEPHDVQVVPVLIGEKNYGISGTMFVWRRDQQALYVYDEFFHPNPVAREIARDIISKLQVPLKQVNPTRISCSRIFCNNELIKTGEDTIRQLKKFNVRVKEARQYDKPGSILIVNALFKDSKIIVHTRAKETSRQYEMWTNKRGTPEKGFPQCEALCMMVSHLKNTKEIAAEKPIKKYSKQSKALHDKLYESETVRNNMLPKDKGRRHEYSYMVGR